MKAAIDRPFMPRGVHQGETAPGQHRAACPRPFGWLKQFAHRPIQFTRRLWREGRLSIRWTNPGINIRHAHCDAILTVLKGSLLPFFRPLVQAADWCWFSAHIKLRF